MEIVWPSEIQVQDLATILGVLGVFLSFSLAFHQYKNNQKWKVQEFVAAQMKGFNSNPNVRNALLMLDWDERYYWDPLKEKNGEKIQYRITNDTVISGLVHHSQKSQFSYEEVFVRDTFDYFLDELGNFEQYIQAQLITEKHLQPYLSYWLNIIGNPSHKGKSQQFRQQLWDYMDQYGHEDVQQLLKKFGYMPNPTTRGDGSTQFAASPKMES